MTVTNKKFVAWGHKYPHRIQDTFAYIYASYSKAFQSLGYEVFHLDSNDDISGINFDNAIFFTHGPVERGIPLIKTAKYILHHCDEDKYENFNYIKVQIPTNGKEKSLGFSGNKLDDLTYYDETTKNLFQPWATDLLPSEIGDNFQFRDKKTCAYVGTRGGGYHGNLHELNALAASCKENGYIFQYHRPCSISFEENRQIINESEIAPTILGRWQNINDYVPCRFFKNISYGKVGITNSHAANALVQGNTICNTSDILMEDYLSTSKKKQKKMFEDSVKLIREKHTYINRIQRILSCLE
jgi:hypothetical protein